MTELKVYLTEDVKTGQMKITYKVKTSQSSTEGERRTAEGFGRVLIGIANESLYVARMSPDKLIDLRQKYEQAQAVQGFVNPKELTPIPEGNQIKTKP
jgi:pyruvate/2-oxoacid:ferredoxin oxidoreductase beta subunit